MTHEYVFYLYKLYLEYRGRKPFQTINLIRQEESSLPVKFNGDETREYLSFRSVPLPNKNNHKNWCWIIDTAELNRILATLNLPALLTTDEEVILYDQVTELELVQGQKIRVLKERRKVLFERR